MMRRMIFWVSLVVFLLLCTVNFAGAATETFDETYQVESGTALEVHNRNGKVEIRTWEKSQVRVVATKKSDWGGDLDNVSIEVTPGNPMIIKTVDLVKNPRVSVSHDIRVPVDLMVTSVKTSNGSIELEGTRGDTIVKTSNGKIEIENVRGNIQAETSNGSITMEKVKGVVNAETSNGSIDIEGITGIETIKTSNGSIKAEIPAILPEQNITVKTSNGSIDLYLAVSLNANIELKTSNGKISLHDIEIVASEISKTTLEGRLGNGGSLIEVRTSNGKIDVYSFNE